MLITINAAARQLIEIAARHESTQDAIERAAARVTKEIEKERDGWSADDLIHVILDARAKRLRATVYRHQMDALRSAEQQNESVLAAVGCADMDEFARDLMAQHDNGFADAFDAESGLFAVPAWRKYGSNQLAA